MLSSRVLGLCLALFAFPMSAMGAATATATADTAPVRRRTTHPAMPPLQGPLTLPAKTIIQNARDPRGHLIFADGASCYVLVPAATSAAPAKSKDELRQHPSDQRVDVDCPADYDDPAWDSCYRETISRAGSTCFCEGNPLGNGQGPRPISCPQRERSDN